MGLLLLTKEILDWTEISYLFSTLEDYIGKVEMQIVSRIFSFCPALEFEFLKIAEVVNDIPNKRRQISNLIECQHFNVVKSYFNYGITR